MKLTLAAVVAVLLIAGAIVTTLDRAHVPPRRLALYLERRAQGHRPIVERIARRFGSWLVAADRGPRVAHRPLPSPVVETPPSRPPSRTVLVATVDDAQRAINDARPGDAIEFAPGTYRFHGTSIPVQRAGTAEAPIVVRAAVPEGAVLEFDLLEGFHVMAPYWTFEDLVIRGTCGSHSRCEHAFHVTGLGGHFVARRNRIVDFNAHFKINGVDEIFPNFGVIEGNTLANDSVRDTANPVTPIDLVGASHWRIVGNRIRDFSKGQGDRISYGAFAKGGGRDNRFERNVIVCEDRVRDAPGQRVGLSLGGGGSAGPGCRDGCIIEQDQSLLDSNLVAACSDDGIYLNRAAQSVVRHNTLLDTAGMTVRFGESSADVDGNLVDGIIRAIGGATIHGDDNVTTSASALYAGSHPVRQLFVDAGALDLRWRAAPLRSEVSEAGEAAERDLCGRPRGPLPAYGAFEDISDCARAADARMRSTRPVVER